MRQCALSTTTNFRLALAIIRPTKIFGLSIFDGIIRFENVSGIHNLCLLAENSVLLSR